MRYSYDIKLSQIKVSALQYLLMAVICLSSYATNGQSVAFPGAVGWAADTPGGRGGAIIRVTNLNADGPGSFQEAIKTAGKRIVVFEVGGVIDLKGKVLRVNEPFLTIAGQTAPSPGITFIDGGIGIRTHDVIVQHIRIRTGASRHKVGEWEPDGMATISAYNVIIDHCSMTWAVDENCSPSGPRFNGKTPDEWRKGTSHRITLSNNIIAEGLSHSTHIKGEHSKGTLVHDNADEIMIYGNLYASNQDRNALFKGGARGVYANNYIHNPGKNAVRYGLVDQEWEGYPHETGKISIVGNMMQHGPSSSDMPLLYMGNGPCEAYMEDNIAKKLDGTDARMFTGDSAKLVKTKPIWFNGLKLMKAGQLKEYVEKNAGARPWDRDLHDKRIVKEMLTLKGRIIDSEQEVGGYPEYKPTAQKFDSNAWNLNSMVRK
ncbi:hypothetical protein DYBT9275_02232 [Dyadobacter sp. CECT 9275]|uniref:Pectate lyase n=1 Tax=Dyadobacter helix TaxID=2822344 RepID=A0A916JAG8_9BACT|nr:hypothetical protein [Dyadobacter sp. CECT 9275]CAG4999456.1 hypothetical protein DYBT9275_02232 [Dyadobacter sp. CECT 9275]